MSEPLDMIPLASGQPEFVSLWADVCREGQQRLDAWRAKLRAEGVRAAHPNDGWVDRVNNMVTLCYPQFDDGADVGDIVVLGWDFEPEKNRYVRLTERVRAAFFTGDTKRFRFVDLCPSGRQT